MAAFLAAIALPVIEPFSTDTPGLAGLPLRPVYPVPVTQLSVTQLSVTQDGYNAGISALAKIKHLEDALAGCKARLIAQLASAAAVEAQLLTFGRWQHGIYSSSAVTEMALTLGIPERTAASLEPHSALLVEQRPRVLAALEAGGVSWRHARIINDEIQSLQETESTTTDDAVALESRLLALSENTTANSCAGKAHRAREKMHPETITTRTKEAFTQRKLSCDAGKDGMSWLNLYLPTISASGIYTRCTRLARALKTTATATAPRVADKAGTGEGSLEHRTLNQLQADIAAILLLGQELPNTINTAATPRDAAATGSSTQGTPSDSALADDFQNEEPPWAHSEPSPAKNTPHEDAAASAEPENTGNVMSQGTTLPTS